MRGFVQGAGGKCFRSGAPSDIKPMHNVMLRFRLEPDEGFRLKIRRGHESAVMKFEKLMIQHPFNVQSAFGCVAAAKSSCDVPVADEIVEQRIGKGFLAFDWRGKLRLERR